MNQLYTSVTNQIKYNTKISALVITAEYTTSNHGLAEFKEAIFVVRNPNAKIKLDDKFAVPRENLSSLNSLISNEYRD